MKLDRNINTDGLGKYALLKLRELAKFETTDTFHRYPADIESALRLLEANGILDWGILGTESEFMLIRLKDRYAQQALHAYANAAEPSDPEWAAEVREMANRSGPNSPWCKRPD